MEKKMFDSFKGKGAVIGMIHVPALPGTPFYSGPFGLLVDKVVRETEIFLKAGVDAVAIENMHDIPYLNNSAGSEIIASMAVLASKVKTIFKGPVGIQILAASNKEALSCALVSDCQFIRAEGFVFAHTADEGIIESCAGELLRHRKIIGADHIKIFTDIKKKHSSHSLTSDIDIIETAHAAEFFESDGIIVTGKSTGQEADLKEIQNLNSSIKVPLIVGSGVTYNNLDSYLLNSDAVIVGSYFKTDGFWKSDLELSKIKKFMNKCKRLRNW
jgi:membrane complex biogenesis BtpA family protein